jgi:hypothetical protein
MPRNLCDTKMSIVVSIQMELRQNPFATLKVAMQRPYLFFWVWYDWILAHLLTLRDLCQLLPQLFTSRNL